MINYTILRTGLVLSWLLAACLFVFGQAPTPQSPLPQPNEAVNDFAGVIDLPTKDRLEQKLRRLRETVKPPIQIAVVTIKTTGGQDIFDYSLNVARGWEKQGDTLRDNPWALLLIAVDDRKYFTQISRDLEGDLTDGEAGQIQRERLVPAFRQGNYGKGIEDTINAYIENIAQSRNFDATSIIGAPIQQPTRVPARERTRTAQPAGLSLGTCCVIIIVIFILMMMFSGRRGGGGGFGGGGGGLLSALIWGSMLSNMGRGSSGWSGGGFGGSSGGDSGGWGGFGGGGSGGFGGGSEWGGGGSGGDW